jgi:hypothetical protein
MKVMYAALSEKIATSTQNRKIPVFNKLIDIFRVFTHAELIRYNREKANATVYYESGKKVAITIHKGASAKVETHDFKGNIFSSPMLYLPSQEFLSINEGFIASYTKRELAYDATYYDLAIALNASPLRPPYLAEVQGMIDFLEEAITAEKSADEVEIVSQKNGRFYFNLPEGKNLDVHLVADGYRKIGTLLYLLRNGSLTTESILFWDEPETSMNPQMVVKVAAALQLMAKAGMQIFIATHDYLLSHELSLLAEYPTPDKAVEMRFFALHKPSRAAGVEVEMGQTLAEIAHNPILEEFAAHYDREAQFFARSEAA